MSWFFNQYVYSTEIPVYNIAFKTIQNKAGSYDVTLRIIQEEVSPGFKMYVPLKLVLDDNSFARIRIEVKGKETLFTIPNLPSEPEDIIFNDLESVLCEVDYESWD
jgi:hypothetical protein